MSRGYRIEYGTLDSEPPCPSDHESFLSVRAFPVDFYGLDESAIPCAIDVPTIQHIGSPCALLTTEYDSPYSPTASVFIASPMLANSVPNNTRLSCNQAVASTLSARTITGLRSVKATCQRTRFCPVIAVSCSCSSVCAPIFSSGVRWVVHSARPRHSGVAHGCRKWSEILQG